MDPNSATSTNNNFIPIGNIELTGFKEEKKKNNCLTIFLVILGILIILGGSGIIIFYLYLKSQLYSTSTNQNNYTLYNSTKGHYSIEAFRLWGTTETSDLNTQKVQQDIFYNDKNLDTSTATITFTVVNYVNINKSIDELLKASFEEQKQKGEEKNPQIKINLINQTKENPYDNATIAGVENSVINIDQTINGKEIAKGKSILLMDNNHLHIYGIDELYKISGDSSSLVISNMEKSFQITP